MSQDDEVPAKKKKSKAKWVLLFLLLLLLGGGGYLLYNMGFLDKFMGKDTDAAVSGAGGGSAGSGSTRIGTPASNLNTATFEPFVVNLSDPSGNRYIRLTLDVEVISPEVIKELEVQNPRIRDAMIMLLSSKTYADLSTQAGKLRLKNEILDRINQLLGGAKVTRTFFQDFVVQ